MSYTGIWSGNFHQLRNTLGGNHGFRLLRLGTCGAFGRELEMGIWKPRLVTTKVEAARNPKQESSKPCKIKLDILDGTVGRTTKSKGKKSELTEFKSIQHCDVQQKIADGRDLGQLVTVFVFDIETTGFSVRNDRIIEFALQDLSGGKNSTFQTLVNPELYVPNAHVHGISTHMVNRPDVPRWKDLVPILKNYVRSRQKAGGPVMWVAHNGRRFDAPFIIKEFSRCSVDLPSDWRFLDTLPLARLLVKPDGSKLPSLTLGALREYYGIPLLGSAHRAMSDVHTLSLILQRMSFDLKMPVSDLLDRSFKASELTRVLS
ncbi:exonuclease DPD1, chloroplastic/mitochondrial [Magnolia sinica]|uniref:exonuclease DPD1, chloroplastic/mitochondrial n=1 Tax=Magnolia sinica TaxID=86752 RepID=UPI00265865B8|nr:exonuclease DPD1, chloroplastic/mitochondrial [Magnolia sinica]XP_058084143.1 exonuclease DPD1, chloroplastic/mitochondrial [Magnolia sinica]